MILSIAFGILVGSLIFAISAIKKLQKKLAHCEDALWHHFRTVKVYHQYMDDIIAGKSHNEAMDRFAATLIHLEKEKER